MIIFTFNEYILEIFLYTSITVFLISILRHILQLPNIWVNFFQTPNPESSYQIIYHQEKENFEIKSVRFDFMTILKGGMIIQTMIAIMVVDFPWVFPRFLVKTEDYGWAVMDIGVSAVMFTSGFTHKKI